MFEMLISGTLCKFKMIPEEQAVFPQRQPSIPGSCTVVFGTRGRRKNAFLSWFLQSTDISRSQENSKQNSFLVEISVLSEVGSSTGILIRQAGNQAG